MTTTDHSNNNIITTITFVKITTKQETITQVTISPYHARRSLFVCLSVQKKYFSVLRNKQESLTITTTKVTMTTTKVTMTITQVTITITQIRITITQATITITQATITDL